MTAASDVSVYPVALQGVLLGVLLLATCVWIGGWSSLVVIARTTRAVLDPPARIAFFREYGRRFGMFSTVALVIALAAGLVLLVGMPWTALSTWLVVLAVVLLAALGAGVAQARALTRMRRSLAGSAGDTALAARIGRGARAATWLRAGLGAISIVMLVLGIARML